MIGLNWIKTSLSNHEILKKNFLSMEEVSAFAAYQTASKNVTKNKSPNKKTQKKVNDRPQFIAPIQIKVPKSAKKVSVINNLFMF